MNKKLEEIIHSAKTIIQKYPLVLLMSFVMTFVVCYMIETENVKKENFFLVKLLLTSSLGISLFFGIKMLSERVGKEILLSLGGFLLLAVYYFVLPNNEKQFTDRYVFVVFPMYVLSHLFVAFIPFVGKSYREKGFWEYNKNLFINFILTTIFTQVLILGVLLAILAVEKLFAFHFDEKIYPETGLSMAIFGSTFIFLLFNAKGLSNLEKESQYPVILKFFTQFVLIPLLIIYLVILYFYSGKILLAWELPRGWVTYLVMAFSIVGILALLLVYPLKEIKAKSWVVIFSKVFYYSLLPLLILLFTAIFTRVLQYGFTEARYYVLVLAIWLATLTIYYIFYKKASIKFIPISLFCFGIFGLLFPFLNAFSVSVKSQKAELISLLNSEKLIENGKINFDKKISDTTANNILDKFEYLNERNEKPFLETLVPKNVQEKKEFKEGYFWNSSEYFSQITYAHDNNYQANLLTLRSPEGLIDIKGYDKALEITSLYRQSYDFDKMAIRVINENESSEKIIIEINNSSVDIFPQINNLFAEKGKRRGTVDVEDLSITFELEKYSCKLIFSSITKDFKTKRIDLNYGTNWLLIKEK
ncbi:DUF4153 domain-containing protein [Flavobacterium sp.]|uniref:DUF4153 domain-containing protein n=1 Tax=Flavobacterium sp. TaxID=239 RepID=UPI0035B4C10B